MEEIRLNLKSVVSELLKKNDCVIIPGFGAFLVSLKPARVVHETRTILPPSFHLAFNPGLTSNDGLLANHISKEHNISYVKSMEVIQSALIQWKDELDCSGMLDLPYIGCLMKEKDAKVNFQPSEYNQLRTEYFGFDALSLSAVERRNIKQGILRVNFLQKALTFFIFVTVLLSLGTLPFLISENSESFNLAGINPLSSGTLVSTTHIDAVKEDAGHLPVRKLSSVSDQTINHAELKSDGNLTMPAKEIPKYYIIGGAFKEYKNAIDFQALIKMKHSNSEILTSETGFYRVSYDRSSDKKEALQLLEKIRLNETHSAWLLEIKNK